MALHRNARLPELPLCIVPMPYNAEGKGPETDPAKVVDIQYEIWDACCLSISSHPSLHEAEIALGIFMENLREFREKYPLKPYELAVYNNQPCEIMSYAIDNEPLQVTIMIRETVGDPTTLKEVLYTDLSPLTEGPQCQNLTGPQTNQP